MITTRTETVTVDDGSFDLHLWLPEAGHGPGLALYQEIFGVGSYIVAVAERLAQLGYVVAAPDLFWRQQPGWVADHDEAGLAASFEIVVTVDLDRAVSDSVASLERLAERDEVDGRPGAIGFCFGGTMAWRVATDGTPACAVSYYGSGVAEALDRADAVTCPVLLHFGSADAFIPAADIDRVVAAAAERPDIEAVVHAGAGHAFDNHEAPTFHDPDAAAAAWNTTVAFLARHLPVR
ncbi:MAG: Carboxymethylenebutenolidase [Acidimicrobiales bacterium]|nr:Carboxymethylenebutenolidase [Acidimicrobiales bacterium]